MIKTLKNRSGERAQWFRVLAAFLGNPCSDPNTHLTANNPVLDQGYLTPFSGLYRHVMYIYTDKIPVTQKQKF